MNRTCNQTVMSGQHFASAKDACNVGRLDKLKKPMKLTIAVGA
jgi:hypothetical protein